MNNPYRAPQDPAESRSPASIEPKNDSAVTLLLIILMASVISGLLLATFVLL